ncbi:MAG: prolipoprotein diacylglyceryl transferase [Candidatus Omnitrophica bacterium]|nr:prolipoprotein diacylglyceryl transferase [Candidatus Omnitrophota bacterium]MDD5775062.1 prolipoprotein diacylglyceryl transferase [Candidatus Omnitrophota bacterium]
MHRILLHVGPVTVYSYGFMLALAFIIGTILAQARARRQNISPDAIMDLVFAILVSSILGARVLYVAVNWRFYQAHPFDIVKVWEGGLVFYGGFILALFVAVWFMRARKLSFGTIADIMAPSVALGIALGRIGCFLNGCCYGAVSGRWGVAFPCRDGSPVCAQQAADGLISLSARQSLPVLPTQLYSAFLALLIFAALLALERYKKFDGFLFWLLALMYGAGRFFIEGVRYYEEAFMIGPLTISQAISAGLFGIAGAVLIIRSKNAQRA